MDKHVSDIRKMKSRKIGYWGKCPKCGKRRRLSSTLCIVDGEDKKLWDFFCIRSCDYYEMIGTMEDLQAMM